LFVAIDEYAPPNDWGYAPPDAPFKADVHARFETDVHARLMRVATIESFFKQSLFSILKAACGDGPYGCISKYFVTGELAEYHAGSGRASLMRSLNYLERISMMQKFDGICGLTVEQLEIFTEAYLDLGKGGSLDDAFRAIKSVHNPNRIDISHRFSRRLSLDLAFRSLNDLKSGALTQLPPSESYSH
jgi:hypothetical protein